MSEGWRIESADYVPTTIKLATCPYDKVTGPYVACDVYEIHPRDGYKRFERGRMHYFWDGREVTEAEFLTRMDNE